MVGVSPIGCVPALRTQSKTDSCSDIMNFYAKRFNAGVEQILQKLSAEGLRPMKYSLARTFDMTYRVIDDPIKFGFKDGKSACCGSGKLNAELACTPSSKVCNDRENNLFWDQFHPTQAAYKFVAFALFSGGNQHITPHNISRLISLKL